MRQLKSNEMYEVKGGAVKWGILAGIGAFAAFLVGVIDGITNPQKCNG